MSHPAAAIDSGASAYAHKTGRYFSNVREQFLLELPPNSSARLLEVGCGNGNTAAEARRTGRCGWCAGIELCDGPAAEATKRLDQVLVGDVETLSLPFPQAHFDVLIMSEVLEHLRDPWAVLRKLHPLLRPGAVVLAGSPNVSHHGVIRMLLRGRWDLTPSGVMDRTHLRWFTPRTYAEMFQQCGYTVLAVGPANPLRTKARWFNRLTFGRFQHLLHTQIYLKATPAR